MKSPAATALWVALIMIQVSTWSRADSQEAPPIAPPSEAQLRTSISQGLGFLARAGDQWMEEKSCNSCHHMPLLLWSHREAKARGFAIDERRYDEWLTWSLQRATDKAPGLEEASLMILALPDRPATGLAKMLAAEQKPDGSWTPAGQFATMQKRGTPDALANAVRLNLLALNTVPSAKSDADIAHAKAASLLTAKDQPTAMESLVFRTLLSRQQGKAADAETLCLRISRLQRGDGGWSSFIGENMSDPLATGQVLVALRPFAGDSRFREAVARAQQWLLQTQQKDGSWSSDITHISKIDRSAPAKAKSMKDATAIYRYWGSAWATIGLLQAVPSK